MKNQLIQAETLAKVMDEGGEKNTLREIFSFANYCLSDGRDNKVYLWENNMRELLKSKRSRVFHEGKQVNGIFFIEVRYRNINFIHVSPNRWWKKIITTQPEDAKRPRAGFLYYLPPLLPATA